MGQEFRFYACGQCSAKHNVLIEDNEPEGADPCGRCGGDLVLQRSIPFHGDPEALR